MSVDGIRRAAQQASIPPAVSVPPALAPLFAKAQQYVHAYFGDRQEDPASATIGIHGQRYVLVRAASMSVEFFDSVRRLSPERTPAEAEAAAVASGLLYDMATPSAPPTRAASTRR